MIQTWQLRGQENEEKYRILKNKKKIVVHAIICLSIKKSNGENKFKQILTISAFYINYILISYQKINKALGPRVNDIFMVYV